MHESYKICNCCKESKPVEEYYRVKYKEGYRIYAYCKPCTCKKAKRKVESFDKKLGLLFTSAKYRSRIIGRNFTISFEDLKLQFQNQKGLCYYTGVPMEISTNRRLGTSISIDRKDSALGYVKGNIVFCCWRVNTMKSSDSHEEFVERCRQIVTYYDTNNVPNIHPLR